MERHKTNRPELTVEATIHLFAIGMVLSVNALRYLTTFDYMSLPSKPFITMSLIDMFNVIGSALIVLVALFIMGTVVSATICLFVYTVPRWLMGMTRIRQQLTETAAEHVTHMSLSDFVDDRFILTLDAADAQFGRIVSERCAWLRLWMWRLTALFHDRSKQNTFLQLLPSSNQQLISLV